MYPLSIIGKQIEYLYKVSIKWDIIKHENAYMRDATECTNSIGYAMFAVIRAIFSDPNALEMICIISIKK